MHPDDLLKDEQEQLKAKQQLGQMQTDCGSPMAQVANNACNQAYGGAAAAHQHATVLERHEKNIRYHYDQADKHQRAAMFFREHPEFDEFIRLIRSGSISI